MSGAEPRPVVESDPELEPWEALGAPLVVDRPGVRCWIETVEPGETRPLHTHRHPWVTVVVQGAHGENLSPAGEVVAAGELVTGHVGYNGPERLPLRHCVRNTSDRTLVMVAVELRAEEGPHAPHPS